MKVNCFTLLLMIVLSFPIKANNDFNLLIKPCRDCGWIAYPEVFKLRENCEIARQGIFVSGMTICARIYE
jgi:hypothetical protein